MHWHLCAKIYHGDEVVNAASFRAAIVLFDSTNIREWPEDNPKTP